MDSFGNIILVSVLMGGMTGLATVYRHRRQRIDEERWRHKRQQCLEACLEALDIVDGGSDGSEPRVDSVKARASIAKLALACDNPAVIAAFENTISLQMRDAQEPALHAQSLVVLRDAIRRELGFGKDLEVHESLFRAARLNAGAAGQEPSQ